MLLTATVVVVVSGMTSAGVVVVVAPIVVTGTVEVTGSVTISGGRVVVLTVVGPFVVVSWIAVVVPGTVVVSSGGVFIIIVVTVDGRVVRQGQGSVVAVVVVGG